jgi:hypothetical protein
MRTHKAARMDAPRSSRKIGRKEADRHEEPVKHYERDREANQEIVTGRMLCATRACCVHDKLLCLLTMDIGLPTAGSCEPDHSEHLSDRLPAVRPVHGTPPEPLTGAGPTLDFAWWPNWLITRKSQTGALLDYSGLFGTAKQSVRRFEA